MTITGPVPITPAAITELQKPVAAGTSGDFGSILQSSIDRVEQFRTDAAASVNGLISGDGPELHTALLATQRAELAFELGLQVRNKVVSAYQEIMRMQV
jgi:flagellar hook-basal body complex protein FliE